MLNGLLPSALSCSKTQTQPNSLIQQNAKILEATGSYEPRMAQDLQKVVAIMSSTLQQVLMISKQKLAEIVLLEEKGQRQPAKGEARAPQQQPTSSKTSFAANLATTPSKNETHVQQETSSKDNQKIYVGVPTTHSETLDDTLLYRDEAQCALASSKNGAEDSADQHRRSKTYLTVSELEKIRNGEDSISFGLMNYSVTSYSLDEEADQKPTFSATGFGLELNDGRRYAVDPTNNRLSLERTNLYSPSSHSDSDISQSNVLGWLMVVLGEARDATLKMMRALGMKIQANTTVVHDLSDANAIIKGALDDLKNDKWEWGEEKKGSDGKITIVPKEKYKEAFELMRKHNVTIGGLDVEEWLRQRSKELPSDDKEPKKDLLASHLYKVHGHRTNALGLTLIVEQRKVGCHHSDAEMKELDAAGDGEEGVTKWVTRGALNELSTRLDNALRERNDANAKLHGDVTYQENLYQSFQTAQINTALIIVKLMEMAFSKIPII